LTGLLIITAAPGAELFYMWIDILFVLLLVFAIYKGYTKGLIIAICSLIAWLLGITAALKLSAVTADYLHKHYQLGSYWLPVATFVLLFIAVVLLVRLIAKLLEKVVQLALLGWLNRLLGICLYLFIYTVVLSILLWLANQVYLLPPQVKASSKVYPYIAPLGPHIVDMTGRLIPYFSNIFHDLEHFFQELARQAHPN
jgi:membrane protein required for colicin V production